MGVFLKLFLKNSISIKDCKQSDSFLKNNYSETGRLNRNVTASADYNQSKWFFL
ncbi:hypothetical protein BMWSH_2986 [Priestia megaterium WSH-002]|uniref:Uncharacterized protein n=1 Tax=Priestia megaterium (strain WSH-002) TaxID=1006007 RepID=A0A8D4BNQ1_PRIMW|nr:hypothetical protein BMWSH_2986 [Priestia megaterium WSH-002]